MSVFLLKAPVDQEYFSKIYLILKLISVNQSKKKHINLKLQKKTYNFREAFAKLSESKDRNVSLESLFPWTLSHSQNKQYDRLKSSESFL